MQKDFVAAKQHIELMRNQKLELPLARQNKKSLTFPG